MAVKITKPEINIREKIAELDKPSGIAGEAMLRAETPQEQFNLINAGRRNLIINGAMRIAQRGTSASVTGSGFTYETIDRIKIARTGTDQLVVTASQETDAPDGFTYSHKLDVTTAESAIASDEYYRGLQYTIEGQDLTGIGYGTSNAKPVTLSFWVKSSRAGTYSVGFFRDESTDRIYSTSYTVDGVGVWEYKSIVIEGDTTSAITADNSGRLALIWYLMAGSTFTGGSLTGWGNYFAAGDLAKDHNVAWGTSTDDYWQITGVQLELGKVATPFEHRSYGEELALCQRYYYRTAPGNSYSWLAWGGYSNTTTNAIVFLQFPERMRAVPTLGYSGNFQLADGHGVYSCSSPTITDPTQENARLDWNSSGLTIGRTAAVRNNNDASAYLEFNAEL